MKSILFTLFLISFSSLGYSGTFVITQKENAIVKDNVVMLGNIALVASKSSEYIEELNNIIIGKTPVLGLSRSFTKYDIIRSLRKNDFNSRDFEFLGSDRTFVVPPSRTINEEEIFENARPVILNYLGLELENVLIELRTKIPKIILKKGEIDFRYSVIPNLYFTGKLLINLDLFRKGKLEKSLKLSFDVKIFNKVWVSKNGIKKGETINEADISLKLKDVTKEYNNGLLDKSKIIGMVAEREIQKGKTINEKYLGRKLLIKRRQTVNMVVNKGILSISVCGEALSKGYLGDIIKAKNIDTGRIIFGEVIDANTIKVN